MLGCSVLNCRQHVGLQKLVAMAGIAHSSLGPTKKLKFIQDDSSGESALACSCHRILENLELTCAVSQLVYETVQAQQRVFGTGSGCLLFLAGAWSRAALECLHRGMSVSNIISALSEGIEICIDVCRKSSISTDDVGVVPSKSLQASVKAIMVPSREAFHLKGSISVGDKTLNISGQRKIKLSRHFCGVESENLSLAQQFHQPKPPNIHHIAEGLRHGCINAMNLVLEVHQMQSKSHEDISSSSFDISQVMTCVVPGLPEEHASVSSGCIVLLSAEQTAVVHLLKEKPLKVAFINGDLSHTFRHVGFIRPVRIHRVIDQSAMSGPTSEEVWMVKVMTLLLNLEVNLIVVSGHVSKNVIQCCCSHRILTVEKVKASFLNTIANATGGVAVTYASQLNKHCVGTGAKVTIWRDLSGTERKLSAVNISTSGRSGLATVVLTSCVHGKLQLLEDQFWACAYRLHHALKDKAILPGAGVTEMLCIYQLQKQAVHHPRQKSEETENPYRGEVLPLMAEGLIDYISTVMVNTGKFSKVTARTLVNQQLQDCAVLPDFKAKFSQILLDDVTEDSSSTSATSYDRAQEMKIYDNLSVKLEAWRKALDLVCLVLQTDAEIITSVDQKNVGHQNLMFL